MLLHKIKSIGYTKLQTLKNGCKFISFLMLFIIMAGSPVIGHIQVMKTGEKIVKVCWKPNNEIDLSHYILTVWDDSDTTLKFVVQTADTCYQFIISSDADTVYAKCVAVDSSGNVSAPSHAWTKYEILKLDFNHDDNNRIDIMDYQKFIEKYRQYRGKTVSHEGQP